MSRLLLPIAVVVVLAGCAAKSKPPAPASQPPSRNPAWTEPPQSQRADEQKAVDTASHGSR